MRSLLLLILLTHSASAWCWDKENFKSELLAPWQAEARWILIGGSLATATATALQRDTNTWHRQTAATEPLGEGAKIGDYMGQLIPNGIYLIGQSIASYYGFKKASSRAWGMFKATAYACGVTTVLKYTIRQKRPGTNERNSWPSGHSTSAAAFAGYVWGEHGAWWGVPATMMAGFVGYSRINDNRHYLHDVLGGLTIGMSYGLGMSRLLSPKGAQSAQLVPLINSEIQGLAYMATF
jgi:membrane-associated phospholipid phosphatase